MKLFALMLAIALPCFSQQRTNLAVSAHFTNVVITVTNYFRASDDFRKVNGQLYNIQKSVLWKNVKGEFFAKERGMVILATFTEKTRSYRTGNLNASQRAGAYSAGGSGIVREKYRDYGKRIALTNFSEYATAAEGMNVSDIAMQIGTVDYAGTSLELYDCGMPYIVAVPATITNRVILKK